MTVFRHLKTGCLHSLRLPFSRQNTLGSLAIFHIPWFPPLCEDRLHTLPGSPVQSKNVGPFVQEWLRISRWWQQAGLKQAQGYIPMKPARNIWYLFFQISVCSVLLSDVLGLDSSEQKHSDYHFFSRCILQCCWSNWLITLALLAVRAYRWVILRGLGEYR